MVFSTDVAPNCTDRSTYGQLAGAVNCSPGVPQVDFEMDWPASSLLNPAAARRPVKQQPGRATAVVRTQQPLLTCCAGQDLTKVADLQRGGVGAGVEHQVVELDVPVDYAQTVAVVDCDDHLLKQPPSIGFGNARHLRSTCLVRISDNPACRCRHLGS